MSPLPYSADLQTEATCHYRQPFRIYASDIYCDANITFLSQTRNKTDVFFGVFHSFVNPPPTGGTHGATMTCRNRRARPTPKPTVGGMPPKANENAGIRQGLPSGLAKRAVPPCKTAHAALPNGTYRKAERPVLQRQGGQPRNPLQARLFAEAGPWAPRPHATRLRKQSAQGRDHPQQATIQNKGCRASRRNTLKKSESIYIISQYHCKCLLQDAMGREPHRNEATAAATQRSVWNAPGHGRCHACKDKYHITIIASLDARISLHIAYKPHNPQNRTIILPDKGLKSQQ